MLSITNLHVRAGEREILKGLSLTLEPGKLHAIMGPNGAGKSTLGHVLAGREGYEVTQGSIEFNGVDLLALELEERAAAGVFLAFQYPVEIPGVNNTYFLRAALNAQRKARGEDELDAMQFLKLVRQKLQVLHLKDELLHTDWTAYIINKVVKDDPRFGAAKERCKDLVWQLYMDVIAEEKAWADYLFAKGTVIGLNAKVMKDFVDWTAQLRLKEIGLKYDAGVKSTPLPWFNKHLNTSKKQTALQENESVSYVIGSMTSDLVYDDLPDL